METELEIVEEEIDGREVYIVGRNMVKYGGGFVKPLGEALCHADNDNTRRIKKAWPEYWAKYRDMGKEAKKPCSDQGS